MDKFSKLVCSAVSYPTTRYSYLIYATLPRCTSQGGIRAGKELRAWLELRRCRGRGTATALLAEAACNTAHLHSAAIAGPSRRYPVALLPHKGRASTRAELLPL